VLTIWNALGCLRIAGALPFAFGFESHSDEVSLRPYVGFKCYDVHHMPFLDHLALLVPFGVDDGIAFYR
jgi:hypothetical protein